MKLIALYIFLVFFLVNCSNLETPRFLKKIMQKKEVEYYQNGCKKYSVSFFNNKFDGPMMKWDENCNLISEANYQNGKIHGYWRDYYSNGVLMHSINYFYGQKNGYERWYYNNGSLKSEQLYEYGEKKSKMFSWNEHGVALN